MTEKFEIPALLSCKRGKSAKNEAGKFKIYVILNFPALDFLIHKIKEREFQNYFCRSLPCFSLYSGKALPFSIGDCDLYFSNTYV